jgi:nitrate reductase gamma subunit
MTDQLHFAEHRLQETALIVMACVYALRIAWLFRFKAGRDRQSPTGTHPPNMQRGILYSWLNIAMPWAMESTRLHVLLYLQFVVFHLGVAAAIVVSFIIPYAPAWLGSPSLVLALQVTIGAAFLVSVVRLVRRASQKTMRAISSPDDYFSLSLLTVWFLFATLAVPNRVEAGETVLLAYFYLTAFFLVYVPFSKISHYLYYPFTRFYVGRTLTHRGVFPIRRGPQPRMARTRWAGQRRPGGAPSSEWQSSGEQRVHES